MKHLKFSVNEKVQQFLTAGRRDKKNSENTIKQLRESLARYKADFWAPRSARVITYDAKQIDGESVASLNTKIRDFVCANQTLLNQVNFYENKINNDKTTYFKQQKKIEAFSKDNTRLREDRRQLKNSLKEKNFSLKGLVKEREKLQKELALQKDIVQRQEKRLSQFQSTIQNCARELEDEKVQKESPKKELEKVKAEVAKKDLIISSTNKALEENCAKNQEKDATIQSLLFQLEDEKCRNKGLTDSLTSLKRDLDKAKTEKNALISNLNDLLNSASAVEREQNAKVLRLEEETETMSKMENDSAAMMEKLNLEISQIRSENVGLIAKMSERADFEGREECFRKEATTLKQKIQEVGKKLLQQEAETKRLKTEKDELEENFRKAILDHEKLQAEVADLKDKKKSDENKNQDKCEFEATEKRLKKELNAAKKKVDDLEEENVALEAEIYDLCQELESKETQLNDGAGKVAACTEELKKTYDKLKARFVTD